eukprot:TRINITY_DN3731_c0_g1_i2.p1 TRINITY_DN3731_c0_g1~~TRINITY_DN3731_c0_g1_i2.p1  ORF type:complete len:531 (+),score=148.01 TRINITY_DN3731_c0_g1_i2:50-1594(+)
MSSESKELSGAEILVQRLKNPKISSFSGEVDITKIDFFNHLAVGADGTYNPESLKEYEAIAFFHSTTKDKECRQFMSSVVEFYERINKSSKRVEIIYVTGDDYEQGLVALMTQKEFPYVSFNHSKAAIRWLADNYAIDDKEIPKFLIVNSKTLKLITQYGVEKIADDPKGKDFPWEVSFGDCLGNSFMSSKNKEVTVNFGKFAKNPKNLYHIGIFVGNLTCGHVVYKVNEMHEKLCKDMFLIVLGADTYQFQFQKWADSIKIEDKKQSDKWLKFPFKGKHRRDMMDFLAVTELPTLIIMDSHFNIVHPNALNAVVQDPQCTDFPWTPEKYPAGCPPLETFPTTAPKKEGAPDLKADETESSEQPEVVQLGDDNSDNPAFTLSMDRGGLAGMKPSLQSATDESVSVRKAREEAQSRGGVVRAHDPMRVKSVFQLSKQFDSAPAKGVAALKGFHFSATESQEQKLVRLQEECVQLRSLLETVTERLSSVENQISLLKSSTAKPQEPATPEVKNEAQ